MGTSRSRLLSCVLLCCAITLAGAAPGWPAAAPNESAGAGALPNPPRRGAEHAVVTIVEYADFHCRFCAMSARTLRNLLKLYPTQVRLEFRHFSIAGRPSDRLAHEAAMAAQEQGKFWEMHDLLFANPNRMMGEHLLEYAQQLNLDMAAFTEALDSRRYRQRVIEEAQEARRAGVRATPTFVINGTTVIGSQDLAQFRALVEAELARLAPPAAQPSP